MNLKKDAENELKNHIIPFWKKLCDNEYQGFYSLVDYNLILEKKADKGCILNSRILWFFSSCYLSLKDESLLKYAKSAFDFLSKYFYDSKNGGVLWSVTYDGKPVDCTKHTYNQAFAVYALSSYYRASKDKKSLEIAYDIYNTIETKCRDKDGYLEAFTVDFRPAENDKLSENGVMAGRTMNTLLHVFEGYSGLYEATKDSKIADRLREIISIFTDKVYNEKLKRQEVFFDYNYNSLIDLHSYGHDIETSWLLDWGTQLLCDDSLSEKVSKINSQLCQNVYKKAYDKDGSIYFECEKGIDNKSKIWWVQAEGVLGFINEYLKNTEDKSYLTLAENVWNFINTKMIDKRAGSEWYNELNADNSPKEMDIVNQWKCPYHNGRMCLEIMRRL